MLRRIVARNDVPNPLAGAGIWIEIGEGLKLVWENRILFATREIGLSIGAGYACGSLSCVLASMSAQRLSARFGIGPVNVHGLILSTFGRPSG
jgi:hypothetical protein